MVETQQDLPSNPDSGEFHFTHSPLGNKLHEERIDNDRKLRDAMQKDRTNLFFEDLEWRLQNEKNVILAVYGETGSGKSTVAMRIAYEMLNFLPEDRREKADLDINQVSFSKTQILNQIQDTHPGETIISDEDREESYGMGSQREAQQMSKIEQSVRAESLNFIFCSPYPQQHEQHYTIEAFDIDYDKEVNRAILYDQSRSGLREPIGTLYLKKYTIPGYIEKKRNYIQGVKQSMVSDRTKKYVDIAKDLFDEYDDFPYRDNSQNRMLFTLKYGEGMFTEEEIDQVIKTAKLFKKGEVTPEDAKRMIDEKRQPMESGKDE